MAYTTAASGHLKPLFSVALLLLSSFPTEQTAMSQLGLAQLPRLSLGREASVHGVSTTAVSTLPKYLLLMIPHLGRIYVI